MIADYWPVAVAMAVLLLSVVALRRRRQRRRAPAALRVLLSGASRGVGAALAAQLAARGDSVTLMARSDAALQRCAARVRARARRGAPVRVVAADVRDAAAVRRARTCSAR